MSSASLLSRRSLHCEKKPCQWGGHCPVLLRCTVSKSCHWMFALWAQLYLCRFSVIVTNLAHSSQKAQFSSWWSTEQCPLQCEIFYSPVSDTMFIHTSSVHVPDWAVRKQKSIGIDSAFYSGWSNPASLHMDFLSEPHALNCGCLSLTCSTLPLQMRFLLISRAQHFCQIMLNIDQCHGHRFQLCTTQVCFSLQHKWKSLSWEWGKVDLSAWGRRFWGIRSQLFVLILSFFVPDILCLLSMFIVFPPSWVNINTFRKTQESSTTDLLMSNILQYPFLQTFKLVTQNWKTHCSAPARNSSIQFQSRNIQLLMIHFNVFMKK